MRPTLVLISDDAHLSKSREPLLHSAGFKVVMVSSKEFAAYELISGLAVVFLCQSILPKQAFEIAEALNKSAAHVRTIRLTSEPRLEHTSFDRTFQSPIPPAVLVREALRLWVVIADQENK